MIYFLLLLLNQLKAIVKNLLEFTILYMKTREKNIDQNSAYLNINLFISAENKK